MGYKVRLGMIGGGSDSLIGVVHRIAAGMGDNFSLVGGAFSINFEDTKAFAEKLELDASRIYKNIGDFIAGETKLPEEVRVQVVTVATPNFLHYSMAKSLLQAGFHVICEKPVTTTSEEAEELEEIVNEKGLVFAVTHTYTGYPMVRQMKWMIAQGKLGSVQKIDAQYYQGWINPVIHDRAERKKVWRLDPAKAGKSCCMGDIGVHAFNMVEYTTGLQVRKVLADLNMMYDDNQLDIDGSTLVRLDNGAKGLIRASQIATAEENSLQIAVYGDKGGLRWEQENPNYLYFLQEGQPMQVLKPGNSYTSDFEKSSVKLPAGHPEGIFDAMGNIYNGVASAIRGEEYFDGAFPTIREGVRGMKFIEAVLVSHAQDNTWVTID
ncbi:MAG: putative dehydrogenase [Cyclobacteriaceae bacterium]|jgi:predicted dehydrogenase